MATIDIFPLSFNGIQPPLNLLSLFNTDNNSKNFYYPLDLASNPSFAHAIQFTIYDYEYEGIQKIKDDFDL